MKRKRKERPATLYDRFPPSDPCECDICRSYCRRPGWWTVDEAAVAIRAGYGQRMMLEMSPGFQFGVLSPAFRGCESNFALQEYSRFGCCLLKEGLCELHGTGLQPLECRFCHHARRGRGQECHAALEEEWNTPGGRALVAKWMTETRLLERYGLTGTRSTMMGRNSSGS